MEWCSIRIILSDLSPPTSHTSYRLSFPWALLTDRWKRWHLFGRLAALNVTEITSESAKRYESKEKALTKMSVLDLGLGNTLATFSSSTPG